ncbi:hypothetical protein WEB32_00925 [Streptomyces netropsis]|uniref:Uncharacterized protein n=1 Tax=Streptomyces netropsis TaxID=55404 RepID=A0A7W7LED1_STRNE|nr:hypothetical protein [Streptomyces netropsis]MBB4888086.1 hypothetical protein [Streptomyces netropsis]
MTVTQPSSTTGTPAPPAAAEFHAFSGSDDALARHLFALPRDVVERTLWALLLQSHDGAGILVQERAEPGDSVARVQSWTGEDLGSLPARLLALLPAASHQELRTSLLGHGDYVDLGIVLCPPTPRGAFGHPLKLHTGSGVRAYVVAR